MTMTVIVVALLRKRWEMDGAYADTKVDHLGRHYREAWACPTLAISHEWDTERAAREGVAPVVGKLLAAGIVCKFKITTSFHPWPEHW
jgi:hypothetical protein